MARRLPLPIDPRGWARASLLAALVCGCGLAAAQSVALAGVAGNRALLVIDGAPPRMVAPGETVQGVRMISAQSDRAEIEIGGKRQTVRMGDGAVTVGGGPVAAGGSRITLPADSSGHFIAAGQINGRPVQFVVDTGATVVTLGVTEADRLGINYKSGTPVRLMTANGASMGNMVELGSIRIGDVQVFGVQAVVTPQPMPLVLLGNSFLSRFSMRRDSDQLVLERRY